MTKLRKLLVFGTCLTVLGCATTTPPESAPTNGLDTAGAADLLADATVTPVQRYWQIRFLLGITEGVDERLQAALETRFGAPGGDLPSLEALSDAQGAGYRIASADTILEGLTELSAFRKLAEPDLRRELRRLEAEAGIVADALDETLFSEEVLLVRSAALDSLEALAASGAWPDTWVEPYRIGTLRARNELEYIDFAEKMDGLAARSISESTGRLDAFHRLMDDSNDTVFLRERVMAAEEMNRQITDEHRSYATRRTLRTLFFLAPAISRYFRDR